MISLRFSYRIEMGNLWMQYNVQYIDESHRTFNKRNLCTHPTECMNVRHFLSICR